MGIPDTYRLDPVIGVITCDVLRDEIRTLASSISNVVRVDILEQGLHNDPPKLRSQLQIAVEKMEADFPQINAIALRYGLCSRGVEDVHASRCNLVIPRAHDCITLLLGDRRRYAEYVAKNPGTYWYSPGWNRCHIPPGQERHEAARKKYLEKFEPDDVEYLMENEQAWFSSYTRAAFVDLGLTPTQADEDYTKKCAQWLKWSYDRQVGDPTLLIDLLRGNWDDERFIILEPGQAARMTADDKIMTPVQVTVNRKAI